MNPATLAYMRSQTTRYYLRDSCVIEVEQSSEDEDFITTTSWVQVASCKCRLLPAGTGDSESAETFANQESIKVLRRLIVPHGTALDVGQRVTVGSEIYYLASLDIEATDEVFRAAVVVQMAGANNG
jgi:hypothetical protein